MPYQDWYTQATNAAVTMNMPPALVPPTQSFVAPPRQPLVPVNARPLNNTDAPVEQEDRSTFAGSNLRSAGRFEKQTAMINPFAAQSMILGGTDTGMITEAAENKKRKNVYTDKFEFRTQADMAADQYNSDIGMNNMNSLYEDTYLL
tara:strand:+ start:3353 stop:3793 length:441 start_codon:yes stop_codon:yes gene_type:complete